MLKEKKEEKKIKYQTEKGSSNIGTYVAELHKSRSDLLTTTHF